MLTMVLEIASVVAMAYVLLSVVRSTYRKGAKEADDKNDLHTKFISENSSPLYIH